MVEKLDPEQLGVVTFDSFVDEFYPGVFTASADSTIQPFTVYHYNGLKRSTLAKVVSYTHCCILSCNSLEHLVLRKLCNNLPNVWW